MSLGAMAFGMFWLLWILFETLFLGFGGLTLAVLHRDDAAAAGRRGGLANAIFGTLMIVTLATLLSTPIGILAGIYLAEYGKRTLDRARRRGSSTTSCCRRRRSSSACSSTRCRGAAEDFSGWAGVLALALIAIPVVVRTTENMLQLVPTRCARPPSRSARRCGR